MLTSGSAPWQLEGAKVRTTAQNTAKVASMIVVQPGSADSANLKEGLTGVCIRESEVRMRSKSQN